MLNSRVILKPIYVPLSAIIQYYLSTDAQIKGHFKADMYTSLNYTSILSISICSTQAPFQCKYAYSSQLLFNIIYQHMLNSSAIFKQMRMPLSAIIPYYLSTDAQLKGPFDANMHTPLSYYQYYLSTDGQLTGHLKANMHTPLSYY